MTTKQLTVIGIIIASVLGLIPLIYNVPSSNLNVKIYNWYVNVTLNEDNTTYTGLKTTFPSYITNTGNVPVHIVVCDVFLSVNGKPSNLSDERLSEIAYLKPQDIFAYNFTKYFNVSIPVKTANLGDLTNYLLVVGYYTQNIKDIKYVWIDPSKIT